MVAATARSTAPRGPTRDELARRAAATRSCTTVAAEVLGAIRKAKSDAQRSMRTEVDARRRARHRRAARRARAARSTTCATPGAIAGDVDVEAGDELAVEVELAPTRRRRELTRGPGDARAWLDAHVNLETGVGVPARSTGGERSPTLERDARADRAARLARSSSTRSIHLTGTNGKTSAARMTTALLVAAGLSVGAVHEPAPRAGQRADRLERRADRRRRRSTSSSCAVADGRGPRCPTRPSYFEILTAAALRWFADVAVDVAVVEVGLGGTWDATNVVDGAVAVVTNVSIDHVEYLGPTRAEIAAEKAGIVKPGATLVLGETDPELVPIFAAREPGADRACATATSACASQRARASAAASLDLVHARTRRYDEVFLPLHGAHQADNAAIALAAAECFLGRAARRRRRRRARSRACGRPGGSRSSGTSRSCCSTARTTSPARTRCAPRSTRSSPPRRARSSSACCARRTRTRCSTALGVARARRMLVCCRPPSPRALDPTVVADAALRPRRRPTSAIEVVDDVADAVGARARRHAGPTARSSSPARCTSSARPAPCWCREVRSVGAGARG